MSRRPGTLAGPSTFATDHVNPFLFRTTLLCCLSLASVACDGREAVADGTIARAPIPPGVDPRMVEYRSDGVLIASPDSLRKTSGYVIDSVFSAEENLRRFQATVGGTPPARLAGGARSTDALLRQYWALLSTGDTVAMTPLLVSRAEYAYLYAPFSPEVAAGLPPHVGWELILSQTGRGLTRALQVARAEPAPVLGTLCSDVPRPVGGGQLYGPCGVILRRSASVDTVWAVKSLYTRDGVHKLLGLQNELGGN